MQNPLISIAIPYFAQGHYLSECLDSLVAQTMNCWEAFVVDDASPDEPESMVKALGDPRITYIRHSQNRGVAAARNTAHAIARAPLLVNLDADDAFHPQFLWETTNVMKQGGVECVFTFFQLFGASDEVWEYRVLAPDDMAKFSWIPGPGTVMRKSVWERVGGYCEAAELCCGIEDYDFWIGAITSGLSAVCVPKPLYYYRRHGMQMTATRDAVRVVKGRNFIFKRQSNFFSKRCRAKWFLAETLKLDLPVRANLRQQFELLTR